MQKQKQILKCSTPRGKMKSAATVMLSHNQEVSFLSPPPTC